MNALTPSERKAALRIAVLYAVLGGLWIFFSDEAVRLFFRDPEVMTRVSQAKGWGYVGVTAALLYILIRRAFRRLEQFKEELGRSERRFRALFEGSRDALILQVAPDWTFASANAAALALLGVKNAEELRMLGLVDVSPEFQPGGGRSADKTNAFIQRALTAGSHFFEWRCRRRDGEEFDATVLLTRIDLGDQVAIQATVRDESERVRVRRALEESEEKYRELVENANSIILRCDRFGNITFLNEFGEKFFGFAEDELLGRNVLGTIVPATESSGRRLEPIVRDIFSDPEGYPDHENENTTRDGRRVWIRWTNKAVRDGGGELVGVLSIGSDVTERKRAEEERVEMERRLLHAQKLESLGVLAGGLAHDFNNLLTAIVGNLDLALRDLSPASAARTGIQSAMQASHRAADLTRQMLAYSGRGPSLVHVLDLNQLVEENAHLFRASVSRNVSLVLHLAPGLPGLTADPAQVQQVVMNLITNASEAVGDRPGVVTLSTGRMECDEAYLERSRVEEKPAPGAFLFVEVADTGCGMDALTLQRLFDPFFTTKFTGRGLGMSAVLGIVRSHRGAILVESEEGKGTSIRVLFPEGGAEESKHAAPTGKGRGSAPGADPTAPLATILIADDEEFVRGFCRSALERLGYHVLVAENGEQAVRVFQEHADQVGCVLLDLTMPVMDGRAALEALRRIRPNVRILLASGFHDEAAGGPLASVEHSGFLHKPYTMETLRKAVERALGG